MQPTNLSLGKASSMVDGKARDARPQPISIPTGKAFFNKPPATPTVETFGASKTNISSGRFGSTTTGNAANVTGFNPNASSTAQTGSIFGQNKPAATQSQPSLFGAATSAPSTQSQPAPAGLFGGGTGGAFGGGFGTSQQSSAPANNTLGGSLLGGNTLSGSTLGGGGLGSSLFNPQKQGQGQAPALGSSLNLPSFGQTTSGASGAKIDLEHLRPTTKYDNLTDALQNEIQKIDEAILAQINMSHEVADLLPAIDNAGANIDNDTQFVARKLEELEIGLENDAEDIQRVRDGLIKKDAVEARVAFRQLDRLKMPSQYQTPQDGSLVQGAGGLSGWWNHPQTLQRNLRGSTAASGKLQLPGDDDPEASSAPKNLVEFFEKRATEMGSTLGGYRDVLKEVEEHLNGVEMNIYQKHRDLISGGGGVSGIGSGREEQFRNLANALGVFERSIIDIAGKVGSVRNDVQDLMIGDAERRNAGFAKSGW
ncbi:MAG: hypothetical protein Q9227_006130 [Pyrenula ochraceoflavens]